MKKLEKSISIKIPPVRLFLEDVKAIEEVYKEHFETYEIRTNEFKLDSVEELKDIGKDKLSDLSFSSVDPYAHVKLSEYTAEIYSPRDDVKSTGIIAKLKNILAKRVTPIRYLAGNCLVFPFVILIYSFVYLFPSIRK